MKILKFWYVPCLLFCLYCLYTLVADSYEILYKKSNKKDPLQFLACEELSDLYPNQTEIDLKELRGQLYDHFNSSKEYDRNRRRYRRVFELILNRTKSGGYLVLNRRVCLIANDQKELWKIVEFLSYKGVLFAFKNDTFDFVRMEFPLDQIDQLIVRKKGHPYSDCSSSNGRFHFLNECFKRRFRLARYLYDSDETGTIQLNFSESNRTIRESERNCFGECERENCKLIQLVSVDFKLKEPKTFEAQPRLSALDFLVELIGRIFLFAGLFFSQIASIATKFTKSRVRRRKVKIGLFYLNLAILLLSLAYSGYLCAQLVIDLNTEVKNLPEVRNRIQPKTVHLAICVSIGRYEGKTMSEIESVTNGALNDTLESIYVNYGGRSFRTDYHVHRKILFKGLDWGLGRCFPLSIYPNYQTIPSNPILTIRFKKKYFRVYVLSEKENLNSKSFWYSGQFAFQKRIVKRLKSKGKYVNFEEKSENCTGRQNCLERCIRRKFVETYNITTYGTWGYFLVIDRDWFSSSEWNTSQMIPYTEESIYLNVSRECEEKIPKEKPCEETKFEQTVGIQQPDDLTMEIDLQFDVVQSVEESSSLHKMALDLLSIQGIFFGFTVLQLFWVVYEFLRPKWRVRNDKVVWFLICLIASIGCSWNTIRILDVIVNGDLVPTEHYEIAQRVQMPAMVFCLRIDRKLIDRNHQLTGNYLEELTRKFTTKRMFESIAYLNESNEWTPFNLSLVERVFLLNMKCFRIKIGQDYDRNHFHFSDDEQVLRMNFNEKNELVYFMTQLNETAEFSKIVYLDYSLYSPWTFSYSITHEETLYEYKDHFSFFRRHFPSLQEGDVGDLHGQLLELQGNKPNLRTLNFPVKEKHFGWEVNENLFEQLYSAQQQRNRKERTNLNYQQMFVANHLKTKLRSDSESDFSFDLVFLRKIVHSTNEVTYATFTLSLLNLLPIWLELGVLNLRPFLVRFHNHLLVYLYLHLPVYLLRLLIKALFFCCKWLKKLEPPLYELIDPLLEEDSPDDPSTSDQSSVT